MWWFTNIPAKNCFWSSLQRINFHWYKQLLILIKSWFNWFSDKITSLTNEHKEPPSPYSFGMDFRPSVRYLVKKKKERRGSKLSLRRTPSFSFFLDRTTLYLRDIKKSCKTIRQIPLTPNENTEKRILFG